MQVDEKEMVVVHKGEGHAWQWNIDTHEMVTIETSDDKIKITSVRPKEDQE